MVDRAKTRDKVDARRGFTETRLAGLPSLPSTPAASTAGGSSAEVLTSEINEPRLLLSSGPASSVWERRRLATVGLSLSSIGSIMHAFYSQIIIALFFEVNEL